MEEKKKQVLAEAAEFVMDYLVDDGEYLVTCPTLSPENTYILENGEKGVICKGASMDNQIIRTVGDPAQRFEEDVCDA